MAIQKDLNALDLQKCAVFQGLSPSDREWILNAGHITDCRARSWLYRQNDRAGHVYLLESGLVRLSQVSPQGNDISLALLRPGNLFGYASLGVQGFYLASAQTMQLSRVRVWDRETFSSLTQAVHGFALNLFKAAGRDVAKAYERAQRLLTANVSVRVAWALSEFLGAVGVLTSKGTVISNGIGQREIAELAGTNVYTVSRELTKLQRLGILHKQRGRIVIFTAEKLSSIVKGET